MKEITLKCSRGALLLVATALIWSSATSVTAAPTTRLSLRKGHHTLSATSASATRINEKQQGRQIGLLSTFLGLGDNDKEDDQTDDFIDDDDTANTDDADDDDDEYYEYDKASQEKAANNIDNLTQKFDQQKEDEEGDFDFMMDYYDRHSRESKATTTSNESDEDEPELVDYLEKVEEEEEPLPMDGVIDLTDDLLQMLEDEAEEEEEEELSGSTSNTINDVNEDNNDINDINDTPPTNEENNEETSSTSTSPPTLAPITTTTTTTFSPTPQPSPANTPTNTPTNSPLKSPTTPPSPSPTSNPTSSPTAHIPTLEREKHKVQNGEKEVIKIVHDPTAVIMAVLIFIFGIIGMLITAQQLFENPDGLCASFCRLSLTVASLIMRLCCLPCSLICGYKYRGYTGTDQSNKAVFLKAEEFTNELEMT